MNKRAAVVHYDSLDSIDTFFNKTTAAKIRSVAQMHELDEKDGEFELSYESVSYDYITVVKSSLKTPQDHRAFGAKYFKKYAGRVDEVVFVGASNAVYEGAHLANYKFNKYKSTDDSKNTVVSEPEDANYRSLHHSVHLARDLVSEPGNKLYPAIYAQRILEALSPLGVKVKVIPEAELAKMGFDLLLSVGQGSVNDSYVVVMEYLNGPEDEPVTALVGKGVTFDTGGISIKPSAGMGDMKTDMGGSAAVVGAIHALAQHKAFVNVVGVVGLVENMPDGRAIKPGDVVTSLSGKTVENLNTDAEGRLVLADCLTYVQREYDPKTIVDLATLTGAILVSLGNEMAGLFTNSTDLSNAIVDAGAERGERYWRMPMGPEWNKLIDSKVADMQNVGGRYGGSTTAAEFLYRFVDNDRAWAHLDIAGMAWSEKGTAVSPPGAVGFGVQTLYNLVTEIEVFGVDDDMKY